MTKTTLKHIKEDKEDKIHMVCVTTMCF